jgi:hypothetical protein
LTTLVGATAGTMPDLRIIRWPLSLATNDAKPVDNPLRGSVLMM